MNMKVRTVLAFLGVVVLGLSGVAWAASMGTAFMYQGKLADGGLPADGQYDLQFQLFDDPLTDTPVSGIVSKDELVVLDGYFEVPLDFGSDVFNGDARWLEIGVRPGEQNDPCDYTILEPRQEVAPTPYALQTRGLYINEYKQVGIGTTDPDYQLQVANELVVGTNTKGIKLRNTGGLVDIDSLGTNLGINFNTGRDTLLNVTSGNVGIGTQFPQAKLHVNGTIRLGGSERDFEIQEVSPTDPVGWSSYIDYAGIGIGSAGGNNQQMFMFTDGSNDQNIFTVATSQNNSTTWEADFVIQQNGNAGIGTSSPAVKLDVEGVINTSDHYRIGGSPVLSTPGTENMFVGLNAGLANSSGQLNSFVGNSAGYKNTTGMWNTFLGYQAGFNNTGGDYNTFNGFLSGYKNTDGNGNTFLGHGAGYENQSGNGNVFLGFEAGYNETGSNKLYIANSRNDSDVLIYGDFVTGNVGIGMQSPLEKLHVDGSIYSSSGGFKFPDGTVQDTAAPGDDLSLPYTKTVTYAGHAFEITNSDMGAFSAAVVGKNGSNIGRLGNPANGVYAETGTTNGIAVNGIAQNASGFGNVGGYFESKGTEGKGVWAIGTGTGSYGVYAEGQAYDFYAAGTGVDFNSESSIRWKRDIRTIEHPIEKVMAMRGVHFKWDKEHGGSQDVGMIAEEVGKVLPEIVSYEKNGKDATGMDYSKLTPLLIEAVKTLNTEIDGLKQKHRNETAIIERLLEDNRALSERLTETESLIEELVQKRKGLSNEAF